MSYNRTVRCSSCYKTGHNRTGCPELKAAWEQDPESWQGKQWQRILAQKAKPRKCGYCDAKDTRAHSAKTRKDTCPFIKKTLTFGAKLWSKL